MSDARSNFMIDHPILNGLGWGVAFFLAMNFLRPLAGREMDDEARIVLAIGSLVGGVAYGFIMKRLMQKRQGS